MHDRLFRETGKPVKDSPRATGPQPKPSGEDVGSESSHSSGLGVGPHLSEGTNTGEALAGVVSSHVEVFNFDAQGIRVVGDWKAPKFVAKDVCAALGLGPDRVSDAVSGLESDEKGSDIVATLGGPQEMLTINESGLYALIFRSRKPEARLFRRWVTNEVLPSIRRTGSYAAAPAAPRAARLQASPAGTRIADRDDEHIARLFAAALAEEAAFWHGRILQLAELAIRLRLLPWRISDAQSYQQRAVLGLILVRRLGRDLPIPGGFARLSMSGRLRHRRYLLARIETPKES